jgi:hypothetical protein
VEGTCVGSLPVVSTTTNNHASTTATIINIDSTITLHTRHTPIYKKLGTQATHNGTSTTPRKIQTAAIPVKLWAMMDIMVLLYEIFSISVNLTYHSHLMIPHKNK